jgi:hypothetical protein
LWGSTIMTISRMRMPLTPRKVLRRGSPSRPILGRLWTCATLQPPTETAWVS